MGKRESSKGEPSGTRSVEESPRRVLASLDGAAVTAPAPASEASPPPIMAMAGREPPNLETAMETIRIETEMLAIAAATMPKIEPAGNEMPKIESPRITPDLVTPDLAPELAPDLSEAAPVMDEGTLAAEHAGEMPEPPEPAEAPPPRISRFTMLAAALALSAGVGGLLGALGAASLMSSGPAPIAVAGGKTSLEEFQALKENVLQARVELAALKVAIESGTRNSSAQFTRIGERIERVERLSAEPATKLNKAIEMLERPARAETTGTSREATGSINPPQTVAGGLNTRTGALEGWVVRDVQRGTALIEGRMGLIEVDQGDVVPGLGRIEAVRKQDGRWVVVTSKGTIMPPR